MAKTWQTGFTAEAYVSKPISQVRSDNVARRAAREVHRHASALPRVEDNRSMRKGASSIRGKPGPRVDLTARSPTASVSEQLANELNELKKDGFLAPR